MTVSEWVNDCEGGRATSFVRWLSSFVRRLSSFVGGCRVVVVCWFVFRSLVVGCRRRSSFASFVVRRSLFVVRCSLLSVVAVRSFIVHRRLFVCLFVVVVVVAVVHCRRPLSSSMVVVQCRRPMSSSNVVVVAAVTVHCRASLLLSSLLR